MHDIYIKSALAIVKIIAEKETSSAIINDAFLSSYIPSVKVLTRKVSNFDAIITIEKNKRNILDINYPNIYCGYKEINIKDFVSLIEFILERCRQERGIICIHGAGAIINNKLVVCWGLTTGMGKTTLAIKLAENNNLFYSDEKLLIDLKNRKAIGRIKNQYISNEYWKNKYGEKEYYEQANLSKDIPYEIGLFVQPILCEQTEYILDEWESKKFFWHLYEESSRKIRGTTRVFFDNTYPAMSLDTEELALKRISLIKELTKSIPAIYYKGNEKVACNLIEKIINK